MRTILVAALAMACAPYVDSYQPPTASPSQDGTSLLPPPDADFTYSLDICQPPLLIAGAPASWTVSGAQPGETVFLGLSEQWATQGISIPSMGGMNLHLVNPLLVGTATADAAGVASFTLTVPLTAVGRIPYVQAALRRGPGGADSVKSRAILGEVVADAGADSLACLQQPDTVCGACPGVVSSPYDAALEHGDSSLLPGDAADLMAHLLDRFASAESRIADLHDRVFGADPVQYAPGQFAQFFSARGLESVMPLVLGEQGLLLAAAAEISGHRTAAYGTDIIAELNQGQHAAHATAVDGLLGWLLERDAIALDSPASVRTMGLGSTSAVRTASWLMGEHPAWDVTECTDPAAWPVCLAGAELVVVGSSGDFEAGPYVAALAQAQEDGAALLYAHRHQWSSSSLTHPVLDLMSLQMQGSGGPGNYFAEDAASWVSAAEMVGVHGRLGLLERLVQRLAQDDFAIDLAACEDDCGDQAAYVEQFGAAAEAVRALGASYDSSGLGLFDTEGEPVHKLLVLLGDVLRQEVVFPMDKDVTPASSFLRSYFADHSALLLRGVQPAQADLGNFSRSDFSHVTPAGATVTHTTKVPFRSAAVYALPGETFRVTRTDSSGVGVRVRVNSTRSSSTHAFESAGYVRPKFLASAAVPIAPGETLSLTSPYGGPVHVLYDTNDLEVTLEFEGVGRHPVWQGPADDLVFPAELAAGDYDHAEFLTSHFEIHSTTPKMLDTMAHPLATSGTELEHLIKTYHHGLSLALAGYAGPGIPVIDEVADHAASKGWALTQRDVVQHFNADQASCGAGCSGNPYDAYWAFEPLAHGDLHEVGHNHELGRMKFDGREGHATTNYYSYFPKQQHFLDTGADQDCQRLPFAELYDVLQDAHGTSDPFATVNSTELNGWSQGAGAFIQMLMAAQDAGVVQRGWHLVGRLHVHDRTTRAADDDAISWDAAKVGLGFSSFTASEAGALSNNDYLLLAMGSVTGLDYRDWFDLFGLEVSPEAAAQIAGEGYPMVSRSFYALAADGACYPWEGAALPIDGVSLYLDLSLYPRTPVDLGATWESTAVSSSGSSVYFVTLDNDVGPTTGTWWGSDGAVTELNVPVVRDSDGAEGTLVVDAWQRRCSTLMTLNAGRTGGCEHSVVLSIDPSKNPSIVSGEGWSTGPELPLVLQGWRWHSPGNLVTTWVLDLTWTRP